MAGMVRKDFYITEAQYDFLEGLDKLSLAEHVRRALDDYITRKRLENSVASTSPSKKKGTSNGR